MEKLSEQIKTPTIFSSLCMASRGDFLPLISPLEANAVRWPCDKSGVGIISCKHPDLEFHLRDINGLDFSMITGKANPQFHVPRYVPIISRDFFGYDADAVKYDTIAVSLKDIFTSAPKMYAGRLHVNNLKLRENLLTLPIFQNKRVILLSSGQDALIEKVWEERDGIKFFSKIAKMGFSLVTGMNFSIFFGECPVGQAINLKKSLEYFDLLQKVGVPTIPHIYWAHRFHLQRLADWLNENSGITIVTVNCQMSKTSNDCQIISEGIGYLVNNVKHELHFLLEGPKRKLLTKTVEYSPLIHVTVKEPAMISMFHKKYILAQNTLKRVSAMDIPPNLLLRFNTEIYDHYIQNNFQPLRVRSGFREFVRASE